jgi:site-specific DNA-methyltransferase (adenine-specific)
VENKHPTVKPIALMRYLIRLVSPKGALILNPFSGSGTTLVAARDEGVDAIGIERDPEYAKTARARLECL